ncbi:hypothetical protein [Psychrilyobacter atlanticus]|uniref:hypothetical protein n=1 Tax=Psychrilyobacter atlanticus TaxID=271091 RepID=UPI00042A8DED|nr:hypothetical protein [Psychrilyobacter atlanticus]
MLFKLTYSLASGDTSIRDASFASEAKALDFLQAYNSLNTGAKIIRVNKLVAELSLKDKVKFGNQNINKNDYFNLKVLYETITKERFNMTIPYLEKARINKKDVEKILVYIQDYSKDLDMNYKKSY